MLYMHKMDCAKLSVHGLGKSEWKQWGAEGVQVSQWGWWIVCVCGGGGARALAAGGVGGEAAQGGAELAKVVHWIACSLHHGLGKQDGCAWHAGGWLVRKRGKGAARTAPSLGLHPQPASLRVRRRLKAGGRCVPAGREGRGIVHSTAFNAVTAGGRESQGEQRHASEVELIAWCRVVHGFLGQAVCLCTCSRDGGGARGGTGQGASRGTDGKGRSPGLMQRAALPSEECGVARVWRQSVLVVRNGRPRK
jgi:hypothetical protein